LLLIYSVFNYLDDRGLSSVYARSSWADKMLVSFLTSCSLRQLLVTALIVLHIFYPMFFCIGLQPDETWTAKLITMLSTIK